MWKKERVYFDTNEYFSAIVRQIDAATTSIDMEMYIFERGKLGETLLAALARATKRGLSVRLIIDGLGSPNWQLNDLQEFATHNIFVRVYHPVPRPFSKFFLRAWPKPALALRLLLNINRRNHKKLVVIDRACAFVGSMNVADAHREWRETSAFVQGKDIKDLQNCFEDTWRRAYNPDLPRLKPLAKRKVMKSAWRGLVRTNITRKLRKRHNSELLARILLAKHRVWLTSAYFVPNPKVLKHLIVSANKDVDVCLLLPRKSDVRMVRWVSMLFYVPLLRAGVSVYEYLPTILHAKTLLVDDWATVGTTNLNYRSLYHDLEVDVVLKKSHSVESLRNQFEHDLKNSAAITEDWLQNRPVLTRIAGYIASLIKWWM